MSGTNHEPTRSNVVSIGASEADSILENLRLLREQIVTAWQERAVILSKEERQALTAEIRQTCQFLEDLTRSA